jgi:putative methionine-R-sulfoxide reductase with GAF domain
MREALLLKNQSVDANAAVRRVYDNIRQMDISSRGYYIVREPGFLFWSVGTAENETKDIFLKLDSILILQGHPDPQNYAEVKKGLWEYTKMYAKMVEHLNAHEDSLYRELLKQDQGKLFYQIYQPFSLDINAFEAGINNASQESYEAAASRNVTIQFLLILVGLPTLGFVVFRLVQDERERKALLHNVAENNSKYLFDDGEDIDSDTKTILDKLISYLQKAASFVNEISVGNYEAKWDGLNEKNIEKNQNSLAGRLMYMRDEMKKVKEEDRKRIWTTEGLSEFSQIIRQHQNDLVELTNRAVTFLIRYTESQQGSLFILQKDDEDQSYLKLSACYAFDRKKHIEKRLNIGEGMVGQAFLEGETIVLKAVPQGYVSITSGLGEATPSCVIIVPLKYNEAVHAVLELASFRVYEPNEISFLEKSGEFIASAIAAVQNTDQSREMIEQMRLQTEQLRAQEEELRQNLEELEATQEDMRRKGGAGDHRIHFK